MAIQIFNKEFSTYFMHGEAKSEVRAYLLQEINKFFYWEANDADIIKIDEEWDYEVDKFTVVIYYKRHV